MSVEIYDRNAWGAKAPDERNLLSKSAVDELVVHYSSMLSERRVNHSGCAEVVRNIQRFHQDTKSWDDIAYSKLFCNHGGVFEGRGWGVMTAATYGHNGHTQAVCFLGGDAVNRDDLTIEGREALTWVVRDFHRHFGKGKGVVGHRDRVATTCPGDEIYAWIQVKGWEVAKPNIQPWPIPIPQWYWNWAKWYRRRFSYATRAKWMAARPKNAPKRIPDWAWVRLAAMTPKVG